MGTDPALIDAQWRKSSFSGDTGGDCVEVADLSSHTAIRDSKNPAGGVVTVTAGAFSAFLRILR
ncbi:DUF397 domain-containing protein [Streptomyces sp. NPDC101225]|uniref:DUF397 domain-containing protein n=1 Tax=Streptomyces sp. NPDC101225 TaxID=3366135 RepID=UPI003817743F